jgi:hypothetical protein
MVVFARMSQSFTHAHGMRGEECGLRQNFVTGDGVATEISHVGIGGTAERLRSAASML